MTESVITEFVITEFVITEFVITEFVITVFYCILTIEQKFVNYLVYTYMTTLSQPNADRPRFYLELEDCHLEADLGTISSTF